MQCKEWDDANSELFKESHDEAVHKNSYKSRLYELISASLTLAGDRFPGCVSSLSISQSGEGGIRSVSFESAGREQQDS